MNYSEYLKNKDITITTSSTKLKKMIEDYKKDQCHFTTTFKNLLVFEKGVKLEPADFLTMLINWLDNIKELDNSVKNCYDLIVNLFTDVIKFKEEAKARIKLEKVDDSINKPDYIKSYVYEDVSLFETVLNCKPNEHDRLLFKNFIIVGEQIAYCHDDSITMINTDLKNERLEIGLSDYSKDDSLYDMLCKDMAPLYEKYMHILKAKLAELDTESLELNMTEGNCSVIEDIFLKDVPSSFRHIVKVKSCWKYVDKNKFLDKFVIKPLKSFGEMNTLEFTEFLNFLTRHFKKLTAGCLDKQDKYYNWSNDFEHKSVSTWILPTEDEWKNAIMPECWDKFLTPKASPRLMQRVYYYLGVIQDAHNYAQQALVISDAGNTGKGTLLRILKEIFPKKAFGDVANSSFDDNNSFGLSNNNVYDNHIICITEYDGKSLCSNKGKAAIGGDTLTLDVKNRHSVEWNTYGTKFILTTNEGCSLKEHSYRRRFIPVTFKQSHVMKDNFTEVELNELKKEGRNFLNYCYKVYKTCPLGTKNGEYLVMSPDMEQEYLKTGKLEDDIQRLIHAYTRDDEISEYFYIGDYTDSEDYVDFEGMFNTLFDVTGNDSDELDSRKVKELIIEYCKANKQISLFDLKKTGIDTYEINTKGKGTQWWKFLQYVNTTPCKYKTTTQMINGKLIKVKKFIGIRLASNYNSPSTFIDNMTTNDKEIDDTDSFFKELGVECDAAHRFDEGVEY